MLEGTNENAGEMALPFTAGQFDVVTSHVDGAPMSEVYTLNMDPAKCLSKL